jgi:mono/diheme cytochrome c family protein
MYRTSAVALLLAGPVLADEPTPLKSGTGLDAVQASCATCHTLNYIRMNSVFLTPDAWKAE